MAHTALPYIPWCFSTLTRTVRIPAWCFKSQMYLARRLRIVVVAWSLPGPIEDPYIYSSTSTAQTNMTVQPSCNNHWIHTKINVSNAINIVVRQLHLAWPAGTKTWDLSASLWQHQSKGNALLWSISSLQTFLNNSQPLTVGWSAAMYNFIALYNSTTNLLVCRL
jgi:hypothetical protein